MRNILVILLAGAFTGLQAQDDVSASVTERTTYDSIRSIYIKGFPDDFFIWPVLTERSLDFVIEDRPDKNKRLTYRSNKPTTLGLGVYLFEVGLELSFAIPVAEKKKEIYGESDASDLQLNIFTKKWGLESYYRRYEGFYIADADVVLPPNVPFPQRVDVTTRNIGITGNYVFNNKKYSFRSSYNYSERQLRSNGSFVLFGSINGFRARGDSAIIAEAYRGDFGNNVGIQEIKTTSLAIAPGYAYSFIYKGFFINATLGLGPAHNWLAQTNEDGETKYDIEFTAFIAARVAIGYNGDRMFGGLSYISQAQRARFETVQLRNTTGSFKLVIGFRFKEFGILRHRITDLPKAIGF
jgi:hypothetical protein